MAKKKGTVKPPVERDQTASSPREEEVDFGTPHMTDDEREEPTTAEDVQVLPSTPMSDGCVLGSTWVCSRFFSCLRSVGDTPGVDEARHGSRAGRGVE